MRRKGRMMSNGRSGGMGRPNNGHRGQRRYNNNNPRGKTHEGKTKQQAYQQRERFLAMARDALQSGDRVQSEYYFQHVDHYNRILNYFEEQEREQEAVREAEEASYDESWEGEENRESGDDAIDDDNESDVLPTDPLPNTPISYGYGMKAPAKNNKGSDTGDAEPQDGGNESQSSDAAPDKPRYGRQPQRISRRPSSYTQE